MYIELTDDRGQLHRVPAEGAIFGRDPKRCDVVLGDPGVSGVHAKIYLREGRWWLEDLNSSNGTFTGEQQRLVGPLSLAPGVQFSLFRWRFEVTDLGSEEATANTSGGADPARTAPVLVSGPVAKPRAADAKSPTPVSPSAAQAPAGATGASFGVSLAAALAHYAVTVPRLIASPASTVRDGIGFQRLPALSVVELLAWGLPAFALAALLNVVAVLAAAVVGGVLAPRLLVTAAGIGLGGIIGVAVAAFLWHPVTTWIVSALGGHSDAAARSNLFVAVCAASVVSAVASAVAVIVAAMPLPFVALASHVLWLLGTMLVLFVLHAWCRHFVVARWFQRLVIGLAVVAAVATARSLVYDGHEALTAYRGREHVTDVAAAPGAAVPAAAVAQTSPGETTAGTAAVVQAPGSDAPAGAAPSGEGARAPATIPAPDAPPAATPVAAAPATPLAAEPSRPTYAEYVARRDALERSIELDPPLLTRVPGLLELYKKLHAELARVDAKYFPKGKRPQPPDIVADRMREAEIYDATVGIVIEMDRLIRAPR